MDARRRSSIRPLSLRMVRKANAVAEDRTLREGARRIHRDHPNLFVLFSVELYELAMMLLFPVSGGPAYDKPFSPARR